MGKVILINPTIHPEGVRLLQDNSLVEILPRYTMDLLEKGLEDADALIVRTEFVSDQVMALGSKLKVVGLHSVGLDNIDMEAATRRGIAVVHTPEANYMSVAEHTVGMIVACVRQFVRSYQAVKSGNWALRDRLSIRDLDGMTLGVVGFGRIGREVARKCVTAFGMKCVQYDPFVKPTKLAFQFETANGIDEVFARADIVSVHVPLTDSTRHLIGRKQFQLMQPGSYFVNTARGQVVDESALIEALKSGILAGAALDVLDSEPPDPKNPLLWMDNVLVTPHSAARTEEAKVRMATTVARGVIDVLKGKRPQYLANPTVWRFA